MMSSNPESPKRSAYMEWAKTRSHARFNLATSGLSSVPITEFPLAAAELELSAPGGYGYEPLRQRLARHTGAPAECVVATTGTSMANHLVMATLLTPGDEVLIEQPTYGPLLDVANYLGARIKRIPRRFETGFAIDLSEFEEMVTPRTRLVVVCNLHNPSGALIPAETLRAMGEIAQRVGAYVLVDEVYLEMLFDHPAPPFAFPLGSALGDMGANPFIVTSSLTKTYGLSGLRCGWVLASGALAQRMRLLDDLFAASAAHPAERLAVTALDHLEQFRARARARLTTNRALLDVFLASRRDLECVLPNDGTVVFPRLAHGDPSAFFELLREKYETSVVPGRFFELPQHFRIGIGGETESLRIGLARMNEALDEFSR